MSNVNNIYDVAGIGIGPFNLGLSCLLYEHKSLTKVFFDCKPSLIGILVLCLSGLPYKFHLLQTW